MPTRRCLAVSPKIVLVKTMRLLKILAAATVVASGVATAHYAPRIVHAGSSLPAHLTAGEGALELATGA